MSPWAKLYDLGEVAVSEGIISREDVTGYVGVITDAFRIHVEKEQIRRALWKDYPAKDQTFQIKVKADRVMRTLERSEDGVISGAEQDNVLEELHDIINYCTFGARKL